MSRENDRPTWATTHPEAWEGLRAVWRERFTTLPWRCAATGDPGVVDAAIWRDWDVRDSTPDQLRIEHYLDRCALRGRTILHIGIGNSRLAQRFVACGATVIGTTVSPPELALANSLGIDGYEVALANKHAGMPPAEAGSVDFVVDNNATTFCCCMEHLGTMLAGYADVLAPTGQIVTDRIGLSWIAAAEEADPRWSFDSDDLAAVAAPFGLRMWARGPHTIVLARTEPPPTGLLGAARRQLRRLTRALRRLLGGG